MCYQMLCNYYVYTWQFFVTFLGMVSSRDLQLRGWKKGHGGWITVCYFHIDLQGIKGPQKDWLDIFRWHYICNPLAIYNILMASHWLSFRKPLIKSFFRGEVSGSSNWPNCVYLWKLTWQFATKNDELEDVSPTKHLVIFHVFSRVISPRISGT